MRPHSRRTMRKDMPSTSFEKERLFFSSCRAGFASGANFFGQLIRLSLRAPISHRFSRNLIRPSQDSVPRSHLRMSAVIGFFTQDGVPHRVPIGFAPKNPDDSKGSDQEMK